jgi:hypothetical protein
VIHERIRAVLEPLAAHYVQSWIAIVAMLLVRSDGSVEEALRELQLLISPKCLAGLWHYDIPLFHQGAKWFWTLVAARPQLKMYLADQFEGSDLDADWEQVQGLLTAEILAGAWQTMFARMLPLSREMASLVVDDVRRGGMPALLSMTLEIFVQLMHRGIRLRPVQSWPVNIAPEELRDLQSKWQLTMLELAPAAADLRRYNPAPYKKLLRLNFCPLLAVILAFLDYFITGPNAGVPNLGPALFYVSAIVWGLGILIMIKGSDTGTLRFLLQLVFFSVLAVWYVLRACDPENASWAPSVRGLWFARDACAVLEWRDVYERETKAMIYGVVFLLLALLSTYIMAEILLLRMASALTYGTYEDFRKWLFIVMYAFCASAVGAVLFNVEYRLYKEEVFKQIGWYCVLVAVGCAIYICTHFFLWEGGTWNHLRRLHVKKVVIAAGLMIFWGAFFAYCGGPEGSGSEGYLGVAVLIMIAGCGFCLCCSGGNNAPRGVALLS